MRLLLLFHINVRLHSGEAQGCALVSSQIPVINMTLKVLFPHDPATAFIIVNPGYGVGDGTVLLLQLECNSHCDIYFHVILDLYQQ